MIGSGNYRSPLGKRDYQGVNDYRDDDCDGNDARLRGEQWSFFGSDGMVIFFFARTIGINGFSMVWGPSTITIK